MGATVFILHPFFLNVRPVRLELPQRLFMQLKSYPKNQLVLLLHFAAACAFGADVPAKKEPQINWAELSASSGMCVIDQKMCGGNYKSFLLIGRRTRDLGTEVSTNSVFSAVTNVVYELQNAEKNSDDLVTLTRWAETNNTARMLMERNQLKMQQGINRCLESGQILEHSINAVPVTDPRFKSLHPLVLSAQSNLLAQIEGARAAAKKYLSDTNAAAK